MSSSCGLIDTCPHLVCICIVFINTSYEEKAPKHGHGTSRSSVAGPGRPLLSVLLLWLPCIPPPASPLALAGPNAEPSNSGKEQGLAQGRALAGQLGTCRYRPGPGPGRTLPLPLAHQGSSETPGRRALRWGPPSPRHRRRPLKAEIQQGACIWKSAAAAGEEAHESRHRQGKQTHTGLSLGYLVSVDTGMLNENRVGVVDQDSQTWAHF